MTTQQRPGPAESSYSGGDPEASPIEDRPTAQWCLLGGLTVNPGRAGGAAFRRPCPMKFPMTGPYAGFEGVCPSVFLRIVLVAGFARTVLG